MKLCVLKFVFTGITDTGIADNVVIKENSEVVNNSNIDFFIGALSKKNKISVC